MSINKYLELLEKPHPEPNNLRTILRYHVPRVRKYHSDMIATGAMYESIGEIGEAEDFFVAASRARMAVRRFVETCRSAGL